MSNGNGTYSMVRLLAGRNQLFRDGEVAPARTPPDYVVCGTRVFRLWEIADKPGQRSLYRECYAAPLLQPAAPAEAHARSVT